jgi:hypothetical protein
MPVGKTEIGGEEFILGSHLAVNGAGQIYVTGEFDGSVTFGSTTLNESEPGAHEDGLGGFLAKLDTDGQTWLWARAFGGLGERVALDAVGNPFITGTFFDHAVFGAENLPTAQALDSMAEEDQYVAKYDAAGNFKFARALPGDGESSENIVKSDKVDVDVVPIRLVYNGATGSMSVSGDFSGSLTLDNVMLNSGANRHGFVAALETVPPPGIISAQLDGRTLLVSGVNFDAGALILLNGIQQRTKNDQQNPTGLLIGKKLGNQIAPGQSVRLQVRNFDGKLSAEFIFVRPTG